jgi:hypothetical protein
MADKFSLADFAQKTLEVKFCGDSARSAGEKNLSRRLRGFRAESSRTIFSAVILRYQREKKTFPADCADLRRKLWNYFLRGSARFYKTLFSRGFTQKKLFPPADYQDFSGKL